MPGIQVEPMIGRPAPRIIVVPPFSPKTGSTTLVFVIVASLGILTTVIIACNRGALGVTAMLVVIIVFWIFIVAGMIAVAVSTRKLNAKREAHLREHPDALADPLVATLD